MRVVIHFDGPKDVLDSRAADVSMHGIFIRTSTEVAMGTTVFLDLDIGSETISIDGVVVRVSSEDDPGGPGIGVEYTGIGEQARARLEELTSAA